MWFDYHMQAEDVDKASARLEAADDDRAAVLSRLQVVHRQKTRQLSETVAAVQQVMHAIPTEVPRLY